MPTNRGWNCCKVPSRTTNPPPSSRSACAARPVRAIVASLAGPLERGRLLDRPVACLARVLDENLLPHLAAARHLLPLLAESAAGHGQVPAHYIVVGPTGAEQGWAGYGDISIAAAAQTMLAKVLHGEAATLGVRVQMLSLDHPLCDPLDVNRNCARWPSALSVGRRVVAMLTSRQPVAPVVRFSAPWTPPPAATLYPLPSESSPQAPIPPGLPN